MIGCSPAPKIAIDNEGALLDFDYREGKVSQVIMSSARHVILAADSIKPETTLPECIGHVSQIYSFVTDRYPNKEFRSSLTGFAIRTVETDQ